MSKSKLPIPAKLKAAALSVAKKAGHAKVYITEDGHAYLESRKSLMDYHCRTYNKTYWEVEAEAESPAAAQHEAPKEVKKEKAAASAEVANTLSEEEKQKIVGAAGAAGAPDASLVEKLKGLSLDKLSAKTKDELKGYAADLKIEVSYEDTKPVIAEAILKVVNA